MSARGQFLAMLFAQLIFRESLRDIETCLRRCPHLYAMGFRGNITRTNLAYANGHRDWRVYEALAQVLARKARRLHANDSAIHEIDEVVYAVDASTIDLCLALFPWAHFRTTKAAIKLHTQIDLSGSIPVFIRVTDGTVHDVNILDEMAFEAGSIYVFDRGYLDFGRLNRIARAGAWFVIRSKKNTHFTVVESKKIDKTNGLRCDQTIRLTGQRARKSYPDKLRRIAFVDPETGKRLVFLTNNFNLPAAMVAMTYRRRWDIELFFKWIKQNLKIRVFYGRSENAVCTQIWVAICAYLMVACLNKVHGIGENLSRILQVLSVNIFQKVAVAELFTEDMPENFDKLGDNQLTFNGF